jgi:hypothetical protein
VLPDDDRRQLLGVVDMLCRGLGLDGVGIAAAAHREELTAI